MFFTDRAKTGKPVGGALSDRALAAVEAYVKVLGVELHGDAPIFRNRSGAPYSSDTLGDDFRDIRHLEFGPEENRTLADFRRSGTQEAFVGDAKPADVSHAMGNTIATSNMLFATYNPVSLASVRKVHEARIRGRQMLREGGRNCPPGARPDGRRGNEMKPKSRNTTARKVGTAGTRPAKSLKYGGSDGARTRDLRRDRPYK